MSSPTCGMTFDIMETAHLLESQLRQLEEVARSAKNDRSANLLLERKLEKDLEALQLIYKREVVTTKKLSKRCSRVNVVDTWKPPSAFADASNVVYDQGNATAEITAYGSGVTRFVDPTTRAASAFVYYPEAYSDSFTFNGEVWRDPSRQAQSITTTTTLAINTVIPFFQDSATNPLIPRYIDHPETTLPSIAVTYDDVEEVDLNLAVLLASSSLDSSSDLADAVLKVMDREKEDGAVVHSVLSTSDVDNNAAGRKRGVQTVDMDDEQSQRKRVRFTVNDEGAENDAAAVWRNATAKRPVRRGVFGGRVDRTRKFTSKS